MIQNPNTIPEQQTRKKATGYTNIGKYLEANKSNRLGSTIQSGISGQSQQAQSELQKQKQGFTEKSEAGRLGTEADVQARSSVLDRFSSPSGFVDPTEEEISQFGRFRSGYYGGPKELDQGQKAIAQAKAQEAEELGKLTQSQGGRQGLLQRFAGGPGYAQGQQKLDTLLLGQTGAGQLKEARRGTLGLQGQVTEADQAARARGQQLKGEAQEFGRKTQESLTGIQNPLEQVLGDQAIEKLRTGEKYREDILNKIKNEEGITDEELMSLGLTDQQAKQYRLAEAASGANFVKSAIISGPRLAAGINTGSTINYGQEGYDALKADQARMAIQANTIRDAILKGGSNRTGLGFGGQDTQVFYNPQSGQLESSFYGSQQLNYRPTGQQETDLVNFLKRGDLTQEQLAEAIRQGSIDKTGVFAKSILKPMDYELQNVRGEISGPELASLLANSKAGDVLDPKLAGQLGLANYDWGINARPSIEQLTYEQRPDFEFERYLSNFDKTGITRETAAQADQLSKANALQRLLGKQSEYDVSKAGTADTSIKLDPKAAQDAIRELFQGGITMDPNTGEMQIDTPTAGEEFERLVNAGAMMPASKYNPISRLTVPLGGKAIGGMMDANPIFDGPLGKLNTFAADTAEAWQKTVDSSLGKVAGTVICTELYRQGLMSEEIFLKDQEFGKNLIENDPNVYYGYVAWAQHIAKGMSKSKLLTKIVSPIALAWANEMAGNPNMLGKCILKIGIPACRFIGRFYAN